MAQNSIIQINVPKHSANAMAGKRLHAGLQLLARDGILCCHIWSWFSDAFGAVTPALEAHPPCSPTVTGGVGSWICSHSRALASRSETHALCLILGCESFLKWKRKLLCTSVCWGLTSVPRHVCSVRRLLRSALGLAGVWCSGCGCGSRLLAQHRASCCSRSPVLSLVSHGTSKRRASVSLLRTSTSNRVPACGRPGGSCHPADSVPTQK